MIKKLFAITLGFLLALLVSELVLRFSPVSTGWENSPPSQNNPLIRYIHLANFTYSRGWRFENTVRGRFNNYGYVSQHHYDAMRRSIVFIGDSYTEAAMVSDGDRAHERVHKRLSPERQVISLGQVGADLADCLVAARFAAQNFDVESIVFLLNAGDFSKASKEKIRGFWFARDENNVVVIKSAAKIDARNLFYSSSLLSYIYGNLKFSPDDLWASCGLEKATMKLVVSTSHQKA